MGHVSLFSRLLFRGVRVSSLLDNAGLPCSLFVAQVLLLQG